MTLNHKQMFQEQQKNILYQSMNSGNYGGVSNTIQKIQIKDIEQKKNHIAYRILTMLSGTNRITKHSNASRRYSDFQKLHIYFKYIFFGSKMTILPKLPSKHGIHEMIDIWEESKAEFFNERKEDLEIYLNLLVENQYIKVDPILKQFLEEGPTDKLEEEITKAKINIPSSAPEKAYNVIKNTINSVKSIFDNFNAPVIEVEQGLKSKIDKIEKTKATIIELLSLQNQRAKCLKVKQKQLSALKNNQNNSLMQGLAQTLKQKILTSIGYSQPQNSNCLPCIEKLYNYIEMKFKDEKNHSDKMQEMKKCLKTMIARCDSVLEIYQEIISDKEHIQRIPKRLAQLDELINIQFYIKEGLIVLQQYSHYYKIINKLVDNYNNNMLSRVNEEDDEEDA